MDRRDFLETTAALTWLGAASRAEARMTAAAPFAFRLAETAGIRRYGYPVSFRLPIDDPVEDLRLTREGREVPAQIRRVAGPGGPVTILDFNASPGPFEVEDYAIVPADGQPARPPSDRGMRAATGKGTIEVSNPPYITYSLGEDMGGFLRSVRIPGVEFLKPDSAGFFVGSRAGRTYLGPQRTEAADAPRARVTRQGPLAVGLGFERSVAFDGGPALAWKMAMTFPSSKSWVEVDWTIADPEDRIASMGLDLNLQLEGSPVLIDCGAPSTVYTILEPRERLAFEAGGALKAQGRDLSWRIARGRAEPLPVEAAGERKDSAGSPPEGWVHVMDHRRCTAMAVADFGRPSAAALDRFEIDATGLLRFERQFRPAEGSGPLKPLARRLRFWLHFVTMPVQVGARTSPQAMLAPLRVTTP